MLGTCPRFSRFMAKCVRSASVSLILNLNLNLTLMVTYLCDWRAAVAVCSLSQVAMSRRGQLPASSELQAESRSLAPTLQVLFAFFFRQPKTVAKCLYSTERNMGGHISLISNNLQGFVLSSKGIFSYKKRGNMAMHPLVFNFNVNSRTF